MSVGEEHVEDAFFPFIEACVRRHEPVDQGFAVLVGQGRQQPVELGGDVLQSHVASLGHLGEQAVAVLSAVVAESLIMAALPLDMLGSGAVELRDIDVRHVELQAILDNQF